MLNITSPIFISVIDSNLVQMKLLMWSEITSDDKASISSTKLNNRSTLVQKVHVNEITNGRKYIVN